MFEKTIQNIFCFVFLHSIQFQFFILFFSFASSEAQEILKNRVAQGGSDYLKADKEKENDERGKANHLFKVASQDIETTYSRSLEISEKYQSVINHTTPLHK